MTRDIEHLSFFFNVRNGSLRHSEHFNVCDEEGKYQSKNIQRKSWKVYFIQMTKNILKIMIEVKYH